MTGLDTHDRWSRLIVAARINKRLFKGWVAVIGVLALCVVASGAPRDDKAYTLPPELKGRARIVHVETVTPVKMIDRTTGLMADAEEPLAHPADVVIEVINDEAVARGRVGEAFVEEQPCVALSLALADHPKTMDK